MAALIRSRRNFANSFEACSKAGQFFSWSAFNSRPACRAANRASAKACMSSTVGRQRWPPSGRPRCWAYTSDEPAIASAVVPASTAFHIGFLQR